MLTYIIYLLSGVVSFAAALVLARSQAEGAVIGILAGAAVLLLPEIWGWLILGEKPIFQLLRPPGVLLPALLCVVGGLGGGHLRSILDRPRMY